MARTRVNNSGIAWSLAFLACMISLSLVVGCRREPEIELSPDGVRIDDRHIAPTPLQLESEGPAPEDEERLRWRIGCVSSPHVNRSLLIAVVAPDGEYAAHCGMWYRGGDLAVVEPVATVPEHRGKGLGRAAVLEAVRRCGELGAKRAVVASSQQFYYSMGFCPAGTETFWEKRV